MTNQFPYIINTLEAPLHILGWNWEMANETRDLNNTLLARSFFTHSFPTRYIDYISSPPPLYQGNDSPKHFVVQHKMIQSEYSSQLLFDNEDLRNDFMGWNKVDSHFWLDVYYLDVNSLIITWEPVLNVFTANPLVYEPSGQYRFKVSTVPGNVELINVLCPSNKTTAYFSIPNYAWGMSLGNSSNNISVVNVVNQLDTTGINVTVVKQLAPHNWLRFNKPSSIYSKIGASLATESAISNTTVSLSGRLWDGDITFANYVEEPELLMHPTNVTNADKIKPPGLNSLSDSYNVRTLGSQLSTTTKILTPTISFN